MKICDSHVHLGESGPWQPYMNPTTHVEDLRRILTEFNVERAIVFPNPNVGDKYPIMNDYIAECVRKHPKLLIGFGRVDPRREDALIELDRIRNKLKLSGLKLHPTVECFRSDHPFFDEFFDKVAALELPILVHTGDGFSSPGLIIKRARRHKSLPIILGHLREGSINVMKECDNIYVETSGTLPDYIEAAVEIDENRVLFGSDIPYYRFQTQISIVEAARIPEKTRRRILRDNLITLFPDTD